jgi:hypothetical protein
MTNFITIFCIAAFLISCGCQPKIRNSNKEVKSVSTETDSIKPPIENNKITNRKDTVSELISMTISPSVFKGPDFNKAKVTLINRTPNLLTAGAKIQIEYYNGTAWEKITFKDVGYNDLAYGLEAHSKREMDVFLKPVPYNYKPGQYRLTKYLRQQNGKDISVTAEFVIE